MRFNSELSPLIVITRIYKRAFCAVQRTAEFGRVTPANNYHNYL